MTGSDTLVFELAQALGSDEETAQRLLLEFASRLAGALDGTGHAPVPGIGLIVQDEDGTHHFDPSPELEKAVNSQYDGLQDVYLRQMDSSAVVSNGPIAADLVTETDEAPTRSVSEPSWSGAFASDSTSQPPPGASDLPATDANATISPEPERPKGTEVTSELVPTLAVEKPAETKPHTASRRTTPNRRTNARGTLPLRLFVPLAAVLAIVALLLWFANYSKSRVGGREIGEVDSINTPGSAILQEMVGPDGGGTDSITTPQPPSETTPAPNTTAPAWVSGQIDRTSRAYTIVVSSETTRTEAEAIARSIFIRLNRPTDVFLHTENRETRYRVGVGAFDSSTEAARALDQLSDELPQGSWILRIQPSM